MANIWRALIPDPRKAVDQHFKAIMAELLGEMGGKLWRNREAACLAMADLLQVPHAEVRVLAFRMLSSLFTDHEWAWHCCIKIIIFKVLQICCMVRHCVSKGSA